MREDCRNKMREFGYEVNDDEECSINTDPAEVIKMIKKRFTETGSPAAFCLLLVGGVFALLHYRKECKTKGA